jgi:hypothetical protein
MGCGIKALRRDADNESRGHGQRTRFSSSGDIVEYQRSGAAGQIIKQAGMCGLGMSDHACAVDRASWDVCV